MKIIALLHEYEKANKEILELRKENKELRRELQKVEEKVDRLGSVFWENLNNTIEDVIKYRLDIVIMRRDEEMIEAKIIDRFKSHIEEVGKGGE